jgi:hypothetical protein
MTYTHLLGLLWTTDRPVVETSAWHHITLTRNKHPYPRQDSKSQYQKAADPLLRKPGHRLRIICQLSSITLLERHCHFSTNQLGCPRVVDSYLTAEEYLTIETEYLLPHSKQSAIGWPSLRTVPLQNSQPATTDILAGAVCAFLRCLRGASCGSGYLRRNGTSLLVQAARPTGVRLVDQHLCLVRHDICVQKSHPKNPSAHTILPRRHEKGHRSLKFGALPDSHGAWTWRTGQIRKIRFTSLILTTHTDWCGEIETNFI